MSVTPPPAVRVAVVHPAFVPPMPDNVTDPPLTRHEKVATGWLAALSTPTAPFNVMLPDGALILRLRGVVPTVLMAPPTVMLPVSAVRVVLLAIKNGPFKLKEAASMVPALQVMGLI